MSALMGPTMLSIHMISQIVLSRECFGTSFNLTFDLVTPMSLHVATWQTCWVLKPSTNLGHDLLGHLNDLSIFVCTTMSVTVETDTKTSFYKCHIENTFFPLHDETNDSSIQKGYQTLYHTPHTYKGTYPYHHVLLQHGHYNPPKR